MKTAEDITEDLLSNIENNNEAGFDSIIQSLPQEEYNTLFGSENGELSPIFALFLEANEKNQSIAQKLYVYITDANDEVEFILYAARHIETSFGAPDNAFILAVSYTNGKVLQDVMTRIYSNDANQLIEMYSLLQESLGPIIRAIDMDKLDVIYVIERAFSDQFRGNFTAFLARNLREDENIIEFDYEVSPQKLREETMLLAVTLPECALRNSVIQYYNQRNSNHQLDETRILKLRKINHSLSENKEFQNDLKARRRAIFHLVEDNKINDISHYFITTKTKPTLEEFDKVFNNVVLDFIANNSLQLKPEQQTALSKIIFEFFTEQKATALAKVVTEKAIPEKANNSVPAPSSNVSNSSSVTALNQNTRGKKRGREET